jgi:D-glycero-D-manno-heptose 1,7-bisphosphate phosphatase
MALTTYRQPAVFLDKDGTLVEDVPYNKDPGRIRLLDGVGEGLRLLADCDFQLVVVSNQCGVAQGRLTLEDVEENLRVIEEQLWSRYRVGLHGVYYCPHDQEGIVPAYARACDCRKPKPGLVLRAARECNLDLMRSWLIGDILHDIEAGNAAGCRTIMVNNGCETEWNMTGGRIPHHVVGAFYDACDLIRRRHAAGMAVR